MVKPEASARRRIDDALAESGWAVQDYAEINLSAGGEPYLAANSGEAVRVALHLSDSPVTRMKSGQAATASKTAAP